MYHNWFRYGDVEVVNNVRVQQYVANGLKPTGTFIAECDDCEDIPTVVDDVSEYTTPELDFAPWVLGNDTDAGDFAGVMVQDVVGLEGSTTQVEVVEKVGDGGAIGTRRSASRVVAVTADVVARTREAASLGLEWLSAALHPPCSPGGDCAGGVLHLFSACPTACIGITDPDATPVSTVYDEPSVFQTTALMSESQTPFTNYMLNPSAENSTITSWESNGAFGSYITGTVTKQASPTGMDRSNSARLATPAMSAGQKTNLVQGVTIDVAGTYEFSCWVYVPAATVTRVRAVNIFGAVGPLMAAKDDWVRVSVVVTAGAGFTFFGIETDDTQVPGTGTFIYVDAAKLTKVGSFPASSNYQSSSSSEVEGWDTNTLFGGYTPAASIALETFTGPSPFLLPKVLKITWGWPITGSGVYSWAFVAPTGLVQGQIYTVECDIYVPTGSPDVMPDVLFNGSGPVYTTKNAWTHVKHTFVYDGFGTFDFQAIPTGAGQFMRVSNLRIMPGFGTMQWASYFDGASADYTLAPALDGTATVFGGGSLTTNVLVDNMLWTRLSGGAGAFARQNFTEAHLVDNGEYVSSWLLHNPAGTDVTVTTDWCGEGLTTYTVPAGQTLRVFAQGKRDYTSTFRYTDLELTAASTAILFREVVTTPVAPYTFAWTGAAETTTSVATPLGNDFIFNPDSDDSTLYGPVLPGVCDDVKITWVLSSPAQMVFNVQVGWATSDGEILSLGDPVTLGALPEEVVSYEQVTPGFPNDWRPVLISLNNDPNNPNGPQVTIHSMTVTHLPVLSIEECVKPYRRTLHNVVTVEGPKVVEWLSLGDDDTGSTVARVEWTWVATAPHLWHDPIHLLTDVTLTTVAYQASGINLSSSSTVSVNSTACTRPALTALTCADNALGPGITLPPTAPVLADTSIMNLAGTNYSRRAFEIPTDISPIGLGKLSWVFVNDNKPKFGIRVRIWEDTQGAFLPETECAFAEEFTIEYLGANQTLYIDGPGDDAYVYCGDDALGDPIYAPAVKNLRGNYGGPFENSVIGCGRPYYITVDVPNNYTTSPSDLSGLGTVAQGAVTWSVELVRRG